MKICNEINLEPDLTSWSGHTQFKAVDTVRTHFGIVTKMIEDDSLSRYFERGRSQSIEPNKYNENERYDRRFF